MVNFKLSQFGAIHKGALKNHNIANNYDTNVDEVFYC